MKKIMSLIIVFAIILGITNYSLAADEYTFDLQYTGDIIKNEQKNAQVLLVGKNGTLHQKVRIKVDVKGPATPKITAVDTNQIEHNIIESGYWGPAEGFPVQGDFTNTTPIKATFYEAGKYTITLSLINLENNNVITTNTFELNVIDNEQKIENNTITNDIEELPQTGISMSEYIMLLAGGVIIFSIVGIYVKKKK